MNIRKLHLILITILFLPCCQPKKTLGCKTVMPIRVYAERLESNGELGFEHYILLSGYNDKCFSDVNFLSIAKSYIDTCSFRNPIHAISFLSNVEGAGFEANELSHEYIMKNKIIGFGVDSSKIRRIFIMRDGQQKIFRGLNSLVDEL